MSCKTVEDGDTRSDHVGRIRPVPALIAHDTADIAQRVRPYPAKLKQVGPETGPAALQTGSGSM